MNRRSHLDETGESGSPASIRQNIVRGVEQHYGNFFEATWRVAIFLQHSEEDLKKIVDEASQDLAVVKKTKDEGQKTLSAIRVISTFPALLEGTDDEDARAQILLHACTAIFANNATGFSKHQEVPLPLTAELIRQVKCAVDKK